MNEKDEIKDTINQHRALFASQLITAMNKTMHFSMDIINSLRDVSRPEAVEAIKKYFVDEIDKMK